MFTLHCACREAGMRTVKEAIARLEQKYKGSVPMLSPTSDLKISSSTYRKLQSKLRKLEDMLNANCLNSKYESYC
jgi:rRNA-processing arch domain